MSVGSEVLGGGGSVLSTLVFRRRFTASCSRAKLSAENRGGAAGWALILPHNHVLLLNS